MRSLLPIFLLLILSLISCSPSQPDAKQEEWIDLLDVNNISNWDLKIRGYALNENYNNTFQLSENSLKVSYDNYDSFAGQFGHIYYSEPFSHYRLKLEYRFVGEQVEGGEGWAFRNNGIMLHSQSASSVLIDQDFPISLEAQLLGGNGVDERPTMNLCTPGSHVMMDQKLVTDHCIDSNSQTFHGDQWVEAEVLVFGDSLIQHFVNGQMVMEYSKPTIGGGVVDGFDPAVKVDGKPMSSGYIALQAESHPTEFRNIKLLNLKGCMDPKAKNYRSYFVEADPASCLY